MTLQSLNTALPWPNFIPNRIIGAPSVTSSITVASGQYDSYIFCAREAMTISHVGFVCGTATGSPTADVRIETVGADGLPSGTLWATDTNIVTSTLSAGWALHALTASASISAGQVFCVKFAYNSGTSFQTRVMGNLWVAGGAFPYQVTNTGTPTKVQTSTPTLAVLGSGATTFYSVEGFLPISAVSSANFASNARRGLRFQVPFKCRCVGLRTLLQTSTGDLNAAIYDTDGAELSSSSTAFDGDQNSNLATGLSRFYFDNPVTLSPGTWYRAAIEATTATNVNFTSFTLPSADYRSGTPFGSNAHYATYSPSSWTDTATDQLPLMDILLDQLDDGVGGGARVIGG